MCKNGELGKFSISMKGDRSVSLHLINNSGCICAVSLTLEAWVVVVVGGCGWISVEGKESRGARGQGAEGLGKVKGQTLRNVSYLEKNRNDRDGETERGNFPSGSHDLTQ